MPRSWRLVAPDPAGKRRPTRPHAIRWLRSRTLRPALGIAACLLAATLISYARAWRAGTIKVVQVPLPRHEDLWFASAVVTCLAIAGWLHVRTCWSIRGGRLGALLPAAFVIQLAAALALPMTSNDIFSNLANGRLVLAGHNPYIDPPLALGSDHPTVSLVADDWSDVPTPYGPVITALATLAALAHTDWAALAVFKLLILACMLGTVLVAYACCRTYLPPRQAAAALVLVGWNPLLAWEISGQAHNDGVMLLATTIFVWAAWGRKSWAAVLSIAVAFYAKLAVAPVLGLYVVYQARENWRRATMMLLAIAALGVMLWAPFWQGPATLDRHLVSLGTQADHLCGSLLLFVCGALALFAPAWRLLVFQLWMAAARLGCAALAGVAVFRANSLPRVIDQSIIFMLVYQCLAVGCFLPWYATWLVPLGMATVQIELRRTVAVYCALVPLLYLPFDGLVIGLIIVPLVPLAMLAHAAWKEPA
jgi:alpha-1,6-mannosyltransferase